MRSGLEHKNGSDDDLSRELALLSEVQSSPHLSQRHLAHRLGVSLGLTNLLLRNLARKGYVRVTRASWKRWLYSLTPIGFSRKIQLLAAYINRFLEHYQRVRQTLREELEQLSLNRESRVAIYGAGELGELIYLGLREVGVEEMEVFAPGDFNDGQFLGMPIRDVATLKPEDYDLVIVAELDGAKSSYMELYALGIDPKKLVTLFGDGPMPSNIESSSEES